ncbi:hypothetical protein C5167_039511 [Papaver somniferum]|uniref:Uncharacterized protein n=1 Tax=Papaver somniferum TaxID=3469 RepID=A0A4Y7IEU1_PAPSO|nr:transcriptional regulator ATRX homolog [Papaver somniferum]RZC46566.1 hypothetical protein C5167_039511 [Papaver somniferum]
MATGNSSSKRKSSSSHKKKSRKSSSEVKKRSRSHKRSKSKKLHHRDASLTYSDDSLRSKDSVSVSSTDSEVEYKRSRSRTRKEEKGSNRKRVRRDSLSNEDSRESESPKKKQRSKRSEDRKSSSRRRNSSSYKSSKKDRSGERKKSSHKKHASGRSRRGKSVDSMHSNSRSLSSPRGGSSSGGEREFVNSRGRSEVKETKSKRNSGKMSHGREDSRSRSRSCSSFSGHSQENRYRSEDIYSNDNYRGRIRSVAIASETNEVDGGDYLKEENKADIIQAYDDCPSSRSNDSLDGNRKKNPSEHAYVDFRKRSKEDPKMFETAVAVDNSEGNESKTIVRQKAIEKFEASTGIHIPEGNDLESVLRKKALEKFEASALRKSPEADDLEAILRQKALENLKKFRGGLQADKKTVGDQKIDESENVANYLSNEDTFSTNLHREAVKVTESKETALEVTKSATKPSAENKSVSYSAESVGDQADKSDSVANRPSTEKVDAVTRTYLHKEAGKVAGPKETVSRVAKTSMESKYATSKGDSQIPDKNHIKPESRDQTSTSHVVPGAANSSLSQMVAGIATQNNNASIELTINKTKLNTSRTRIISPSDHSIDNQTPIAQNSPATKVVQPEHIEVKKIDEIPIPRASDLVSSAHMAEHSENCESSPHKASSCITPMSEKQESKESGDVIKGSSQFEQKTMSVMRGGEFVQVSYKVYIPNKPPALARRKLHR